MNEPVQQTAAKRFWTHYLNEHQSPLNRRLHVVGTSLALFCLGLAVWRRQPWFVAGAVVSGYAFAWIGHFFVERNRPATFKHPFRSLAADFKMFVLIVSGRFKNESQSNSNVEAFERSRKS